MNTIELKYQLIQDISSVEDESILKKVAKYLKRITKAEDDCSMTEEEFNTKINVSKEQIERGECIRISSKEELLSHFQV